MKKLNIKFAAILIISIISFLSFMFLNTIDIEEPLSTSQHIEVEQIDEQEGEDIHLPDVYFWVNTIDKIKDILTVH